MESEEIRQKFIDFFIKKDHKMVPSSPLITDDQSVLLTTAGMQPFKKYFLGEPSPFGSKIVSCQKCFRTSDIDHIGDESHLTFLEMLGNFSFNDYFKTEAATWALELLTQHYNLSLDRLRFTYFGGDSNLNADLEIKSIWQNLGVNERNILPYGRQDNFWGPTGSSGPCGPTTEIHYDLTGHECSKGTACRPGCSCGRFIEIWNLVFNQYYQDEKGILTDLANPGIDTGMGLERLTLVIKGGSNIFETDLFEGMFDLSNINLDNEKYSFYRILMDHSRGLIFLISEGIRPGNLGRGYIVRRIARRLIEAASELKLSDDQLKKGLEWVEQKYSERYPEIIGASDKAITVIVEEKNRLTKTIKKGLSYVVASDDKKISGQEAFRLYSTYGLSPKELQKKGYHFEEEELLRAIEEHKNVSRQGVAKKFGGHGIKQDESSIERDKKVKLHTATHLLQAALQKILDCPISQKGSDIDTERLRFDFSFDRAITSEELTAVASLVNQKIKEGLRVEKQSMSFEEAENSGATIIKGRTYPKQVDVYAIINRDGSIFSKEVCAGPHVENTKELGFLKIIKEQSSSAGVRRIKAILENE